MPNIDLTQAERYRKLADEWFQNAEDALGYARTGLPDTKFYSWICFLCQQSAELYLKGLLTLHGIEPPKAHDLVNLWKKCLAVEPEISPLENACHVLTEYYIETRYPPEVKNYAQNTAEEAVQLASEIENVIRKLRKEATSPAQS